MAYGAKVFLKGVANPLYIVDLDPADFQTAFLEDVKSVAGTLANSRKPIVIKLDQVVTVLGEAPPDDLAGRDEDQMNADAWLEQRGDIGRAIGCAGPDYVAKVLAERGFGGDTRVELMDGRVGIIVGFVDDESGEPSQGVFKVDICDLPDGGTSVACDTVEPNIEVIKRVIAWDNEMLQRGEAEALSTEGGAIVS